MPVEDRLVYKVQLDSSDLPAQLNSLQSQLAASNGGYPGMDGSIASFNLPNFISQAQMGMANASNAISTPGFISAAPMLTANEAAQQAFFGSNPISGRDTFQGIYGNAMFTAQPYQAAFEAITNAQYDNRMPLSREAYTELFRARAFESVAAQETMADIASSLTFGSIGGAIGGFIGAGFGGVGAVPGTLIGSIAGDFIGSAGAKQLLFPDYNQMQEDEQRTNFLRQASFRSYSPLNEGSARGLAMQLGRLEYSGYAEQQGLGTNEIDTLVKEFAGAGGFDMATSTDDFKRSINTLITNARLVMHTLHMSTTEAAQFMGEMSMLGISSPGTVATMFANAPLTMGMTPTEAIQLGLQATQMVQGTGIDAQNAFFGVPSLTAAVRGLIHGSDLSAHMAENFGGAEGIAQTLYRGNLDFMSGEQGLILAAAGSNGMFMDPMSRYFAAAGNITGPGSYYGAVGSAERLASETDPGILAMRRSADMAMEASRLFGPHMTDDQYLGYAMHNRLHPMSSAEAHASLALNRDMIDNNDAMRAYVESRQPDVMAPFEAEESQYSFMNQVLRPFGNWAAETVPLSAGIGTMGGLAAGGLMYAGTAIAAEMGAVGLTALGATAALPVTIAAAAAATVGGGIYLTANKKQRAVMRGEMEEISSDFGIGAQQVIDFYKGKNTYSVLGTNTFAGRAVKNATDNEKDVWGTIIDDLRERNSGRTIEDMQPEIMQKSIESYVSGGAFKNLDEETVYRETGMTRRKLVESYVTGGTNLNDIHDPALRRALELMPTSAEGQTIEAAQFGVIQARMEAIESRPNLTKEQKAALADRVKNMPVTRKMSTNIDDLLSEVGDQAVSDMADQILGNNNILADSYKLGKTMTERQISFLKSDRSGMFTDKDREEKIKKLQGDIGDLTSMTEHGIAIDMLQNVKAIRQALTGGYSTSTYHLNK